MYKNTDVLIARSHVINCRCAPQGKLCLTVTVLTHVYNSSPGHRTPNTTHPDRVDFFIYWASTNRIHRLFSELLELEGLFKPLFTKNFFYEMQIRFLDLRSSPTPLPRLPSSSPNTKFHQSLSIQLIVFETHLR